MSRLRAAASLLAAAALLADRLAAALPVQKFTYQFPGEVEDMQWVGAARSTILFLSSEGEVHRTMDQGRNFQSLSNSLTSLAGAQAAMSTPQPAGRIREIIVHPSDPNHVLLLSSGTLHFRSENGAESFVAFRTPAPPIDLIQHPTMPRHLLLGGFSRNCHGQALPADHVSPDDGKDAEGKEACYKSLFHSRDGGDTFELVKKYVLQFDWLVKAAGATAAASEHGSILATAHNKVVGPQDFGRWDPDIDLVELRESDNFRRAHVLVPGGNRFLFTQTFIFVAQAVGSSATEVKLQLSANGGVSFYSGSLPFRLSEQAYTVLDATEGVIFLHVNHGEEGSDFGHIYLSDSTGMNYTFSLRDNRREASGKCDFTKVASIEGVYLANTVINAEELETWDAQSSVHHNSKVRRPLPRMRTVISYDRGGEWSLLRPPAADASGRPIDCSSAECSLHLHGFTADFAPVYSTANAVGLVLGVGNVGSYLSDKAGDLSTFLSRDGGLTWSMIHESPNIYEIGDHGGLIVMASDINPTNTVLFSWSQGLSWSQMQFTEDRMDVDNIIIEPSATSRVFHVYGTRPAPGGKTTGVLITIDFSPLHERECIGASSPNGATSDYEIWSPRDTETSPGGFGSACHLGHTIEYTRRKQAAECFNAVAFEPARFVRDCQCTERDYECDVGFYRESEAGACVRDYDVSNETARTVPPGSCPRSGRYEISSGYRLIGGDTCVGGKDLRPAVFTCSYGIFGVSFSGWVVLSFILGLVGVMYYNAKSSPGEPSPFEGIGTRNFDEEAASCWQFMRSFAHDRDFRMQVFDRVRGKTGRSDGAPYSMAFDDGDFGDDEAFVEEGGDFDLPDDEDDDGLDFDTENDAELISPTPSMAPIPTTTSLEEATAPVPKLSAPPTAAPIDLFGDDDQDDIAEPGDAV